MDEALCYITESYVFNIRRSDSKYIKTDKYFINTGL